MVDYIKRVLEDFPEVITGRSTIPADNYMFQVRPEDDWMLLYEVRATSLHHTLAQTLFFIPRASRDTKMAIYFLCTQVRIPDKDGWGKLVRVLRYIKVTLYLLLIIRPNSLNVIKWWFDASFTAHP